MSYGVRQFFLNGGTDAWIVRVVKDASPASRTLQNLTPIPVLTVTALDAGMVSRLLAVSDRSPEIVVEFP